MIIHPRPPAGEGVSIPVPLLPLNYYDFYPHLLR